MLADAVPNRPAVPQTEQPAIVVWPAIVRWWWPGILLGYIRRSLIRRSLIRRSLIRRRWSLVLLNRWPARRSGIRGRKR